MPTRATPETPQLDLNHINQRQHQETAPANRSQTGDNHPESERRLVDVVNHGIDPSREVGERGGDVEPHGLFEAQGDEAGEEEGGEGVDVEGDEILRHACRRGAVRVGHEAVGWVGGVPG